MPTRPLHHVSSLAFRISNFEIRVSGFPRSVGAHFAKQTQSPPHHPGRTPQKCETNPISVRARHAVPLQYETNPIYRTAGVSPASPSPHYAKQTQFTLPAGILPSKPPPKNAKRTQFPKANCQKPTANSQKMRNKPNSRTGTACRVPTMQNKPNSRTAGVSPAFRSPPSKQSGHPPVEDYPKRTQITPADVLDVQSRV